MPNWGRCLSGIKKRLLSAAGRQAAQPYGDFVIDGGVIFFGQIVKLYGWNYIGIAGGKGEAVLFIHGKPIKKLTGDNILDQFMDEIYKL